VRRTEASAIPLSEQERSGGLECCVSRASPVVAASDVGELALPVAGRAGFP